MQVKLCDFGLAEKFAKGKECLSAKYVGKSNYKSPEVLGRAIFDAKKNDVWCLGVSLFMMAFGNAPFEKAKASNNSFVYIMSGKMKQLLEAWRLQYLCDDELLHLLDQMMSYEADRVSITQMMQHSWF